MFSVRAFIWIVARSLHVLGPTSGGPESTPAARAYRWHLRGRTAALGQQKTFLKDHSPNRTVLSTLRQGLFPARNADRFLPRRPSLLQEGLELRDHPLEAQSDLPPNEVLGRCRTLPHPDRIPTDRFQSTTVNACPSALNRSQTRAPSRPVAPTTRIMSHSDHINLRPVPGSSREWWRVKISSPYRLIEKFSEAQPDELPKR